MPDDSQLRIFRYELRSAEQLEALASAPLPLDMRADAPRRSSHRDVYLDTRDDALRRRGITCRLRVSAGSGHLLSLRTVANGSPAARIDAAVRSSDIAGALGEDNAATRHLRAFTDPRGLESRLDLEIARLSRSANPDLLRRPRLSLHYDEVTVRRGDTAHTYHRLCGHLLRGSADDFGRLRRAFETAHDLRSAPADAREHAELLLRWTQLHARGAGLAGSDQAHRAVSAPSREPSLLSPELSLLAFQRRVLALAEDEGTPLRARLRFIGIVTSNLDELYMVRMAGIRSAAADDPDGGAEPSDDGLSPRARLQLVEREVEAILAAQSRCARDCLRRAEAYGARIVEWDDVGEAARVALVDRCRDEIHPSLTPLAMTLSPGHPLPHLPHLGLSLAVVFRRTADDVPHLAEVELPDDAPRLLPVPGRPGHVITLEEVLKANIDLLHPNVHVEGAYLFRVTRGGDLALDEATADDLLDAVATAIERRPLNPAVRVEVERRMPTFVSALLIENLRREASALGTSGSVEEVQVVDGLLDLRCLATMPLPLDPVLDYRPLRGRPSPAEGSLFEAIAAGDLLVHHPFDAFEDTVARFVREAAEEPQVTTIKITLYRVGDPSPVVAALLAAARSGKRVVAMVELKARFDEEHNVGWARALEQAGGSVVYGLVGLKVHAKVALVVRREGQLLRRYVHVGTGNYSAVSGRQYTDLSLFSARQSLGEDIADLFNELTSSSRPPQGLRHGALVAPHQLLPAILAHIDRETAHARAGRAAAITIKVNGLSDPDVVRALYRAAQAGVRVELVVRGICTLRPGVEGLSTGIRVVSVVGRFLEHSRIYRFENDGDPAYYIGSSDLRPRNLRRRVELLVPVPAAVHRAELDRILRLYLDDPSGWELTSGGAYVRGQDQRPGAQAQLDG